ncbi:MAG TPA: AAA family ATPase, partial [Gammaproteobacteria bacterium]|nr:AAA family ATPase [Gammaproteobacteria bacterium]
KVVGQINDQAWRGDIAARAAEWNFTTDTLRGYREGPAFEYATPFDVAGVQARAFSPSGVTANQNTFERKDVVIEVANNAPHGVGAWLSNIDAVVGQVMSSDRVVHVRTDRLREKLTTAELLGREEDLVEAAVAGLGAGRAIVDGDAIDIGLERFFATHPLVDREKFMQQENVLRAVATDGNAISSIEALAGSGKTTTAGAMREVFESGGYRAFAAGPTGRAVRELARVGFERPRTLSAWEVKFEIMGAREAIRQAFGDPSKAVLLIDETGMADTRLLSRITTEMSAAGVKVVLIGDSYQLTSVRAGGMHAALSQQLGAYELSEVRRQKHVAEIDALEKLRAGNATAYIKYKRGVERDGMWFTRGDEDFAGRSDLEIFTGQESLQDGMRQAVADYLEMRDRVDHDLWVGHAETVPVALARGLHDIALITKDNDRRELLNRMVRDELSNRGVLSGHMTLGSFQGEKLEWAVGDRVIARRNHKGYDLDNGTLGTITALDETGMTLADDNGNQRRFDAGSIEDLRYVSEHVEHAYALTAHGTQGATLRWAGVVGMPGEFSREWAYTALSRAQQPTKIYLISGHTAGEQARKDYATVLDAETDHEKVLAKLAARMEKRDLDQVALLQRARDGQLKIGAEDGLDTAAEVEFQADIERYRESKYRSADEAFQRLYRDESAGGGKLGAYATIVAHQDAIQAASDWQRFGEQIEAIRADASTTALSDEQQQTIEILAAEREKITAQYPDPEAILAAPAAQNDIMRAEREFAAGRAAAIAEHIASEPEWLTAIGTRPASRKLREAWTEVVENLAGRYVDAQAEAQAAQLRAVTAARSTGHRALPEDPVAVARANRDRAAAAAAGDLTNPAAWQAKAQADAAFEQAVVDANPPWLLQTLGERPADLALAEQWEELGRRLARVRERAGISDELDNGYAQALTPLRQAIGKYRERTGLEKQLGTDSPGRDIFG